MTSPATDPTQALKSGTPNRTKAPRPLKSQPTTWSEALYVESLSAVYDSRKLTVHLAPFSGKLSGYDDTLGRYAHYSTRNRS